MKQMTETKIKKRMEGGMKGSVHEGCVFNMGFHTEKRLWPQSKLMFCG